MAAGPATVALSRPTARTRRGELHKLTLYEKVSGPSFFLHLIPELALAPEGQGERAGQH